MDELPLRRDNVDDIKLQGSNAVRLWIAYGYFLRTRGQSVIFKGKRLENKYRLATHNEGEQKYFLIQMDVVS